ncbi:MAG TPA: SdrD B-like domain-containing protein, partial [Lentzea sp.]
MKLKTVLAALTAAFIPIIGITTPTAQAIDTCWYDAADMPATTSTGCRQTFVLDPGYNQLLTREDIIRHWDYYDAREFHLNFAWYARMETLTISDNAVRWSGCNNNHLAVDVPCAPSQLHYNFVLNAFTARPVHLPALSFDGSFIGLACGNFSEDRSHTPIPVISGVKYHDINRNGVRDPGEPGLAGWRITLHRDRSDAGQGTGEVGTTTTDANGYYEFRLDGHLPGDYAVTEENRGDWTRTSGTARHGVHVPIGAGSTRYEGRDFGNVETKADAVKIAFDVVDPPAKLTADTNQTLKVRAVLENRGPAPMIDVQDTITARGEPDCTFHQPQQAVTRRLVLGQPVEVVFEVHVTCTEPSFHRFDFDNALEVTTPGVTDPDPSSNQRSTSTTIPVFDESDVGIDGTQLDCASRTYVRDQFECTVTAVAVNRGDYTPANTDVMLGLSGPADCTLTPTTATTHEVSIGSPVTVSSKWNVTCANRSYHDFTASSEAKLDHLHVIDPDPANNTGSATDRVEV